MSHPAAESWLSNVFRCQACLQVVPPRTAAQRIVVETRVKRYPFREKAVRRVLWKNGRRKVELLDDPGGIGPEIVRELTVCPHCADRFRAPQNLPQT
jgi:hypothetical protein